MKSTSMRSPLSCLLQIPLTKTAVKESDDFFFARSSTCAFEKLYTFFLPTWIWTYLFNLSISSACVVENVSKHQNTVYACAVWECLTHLKITAPSPTVLYCSLNCFQYSISSCFHTADLSKDLRRAFCACSKIISGSLVTQIEIFSVHLASDVPHSTRMY